MKFDSFAYVSLSNDKKCPNMVIFAVQLSNVNIISYDLDQIYKVLTLNGIKQSSFE